MNARPAPTLRAIPGPLGWCLLCALLVVFSSPTYFSVEERWLDLAYSHGYLVLALSAALVTLELKKGNFAEYTPSWPAVGLLIAAALGTIAGHAGSIPLISQMILPLAWSASIWAVAGWHNASRLILPIGYVYFAIPWWDFANEALQRLTVSVVSWAIRMSTIPAYVDGNLIYIPSGIFEVAGGCSGLHFLIVGLALAAFAGLAQYDRWPPRLILGVLALALSLFANWLRVFILVIVGHATEMQHFLIVNDHYYFGWGLFLACLLPLFLAHQRLMQSWSSREQQSGPSRRGLPAFRGIAAVGYIVPAVLLAGAWFGQRIEARAQLESSASTLSLPRLPDWERVSDWSGPTRPVFPSATAEVTGQYVRGTQNVSVYLAHYEVQRQGQEIVAYGNSPIGKSETLAAVHMRRNLESSLDPQPFLELEVADEDLTRRLVWVQLRVAGFMTSRESSAKVRQIISAFGTRHDAQVLVMTARCRTDCAPAREALIDYSAMAMRDMYRCVDEALKPESVIKKAECRADT